MMGHELWVFQRDGVWWLQQSGSGGTLATVSPYPTEEMAKWAGDRLGRDIEAEGGFAELVVSGETEEIVTRSYGTDPEKT